MATTPPQRFRADLLWKTPIEVGIPEDLLPGIKTPGLMNVAEAYVENVKQLCQLGKGLHQAIYETTRRTQAEVMAYQAIAGKPILEYEDPIEPWFRAKGLAQSYLSEEVSPPYPLHSGVNPTENYLVASDKLKPVYEMMFRLQAVLAWTAFETLAGDLWEQCLNTRPKLGFIALDAEPSAGDDPDTAERKRKVKFSIPIYLLEKWDYQVKNRMGTLLKRKWDFGRRNDLVEAYLKVFGKSDTSARNKLTGIFQDTAVRWLHALRNAIVHNAAKADEEFRRAVSSHAELRRFEEGETIQADGPECVLLIRNAVRRGVDLLRFVDAWCVSNPS